MRLVVSRKKDSNEGVPRDSQGALHFPLKGGK